MRYRLSLGALACLIGVGTPSAEVLQAQAPRMLVPTLQRVHEVKPAGDTAVLINELKPVDLRSRITSQDPEERQGIDVGWTVLGAVLGYVYYQSAVADTGDGDFAAPFSVALFVGAGALLGTLVGVILK